MPVSETIQSKGMVQPDGPQANFVYWAKMASWTLWEGATLLVGINPQVGDDESDLSRKVNREAVTLFQGVYGLARRACEANEIYTRGTTPQEWLGWAKSRDLSIPTSLEAEVTRRRPPEPEVVTDNRDKQIADLKAKVAELAKELTALRTAAGQALGARERDSMLKLVIGMAVAGYRFDPKANRGDSVKDITNDVAKVGLPLSDDTIRKYLREASELLPPQESGQR